MPTATKKPVKKPVVAAVKKTKTPKIPKPVKKVVKKKSEPKAAATKKPVSKKREDGLTSKQIDILTFLQKEDGRTYADIRNATGIIGLNSLMAAAGREVTHENSLESRGLITREEPQDQPRVRKILK